MPTTPNPSPIGQTATAVLDPAFGLGEVDRRIFGSFVEHMGRCVYTGIYEPGHPRADEAGLRTDVLDLTKEMGVSVVRYPGGNFVSGYRWEDGVGPVADRPVRLELAWRQIETNEFGLHEFIDWARKAGVEPMIAINLGTRGVQEAIDLVEYCNIPSGTALSDLRRANGAEEPFGIRLWCLGNEMDGPWQIGHKTAEEYGRLVQETAKAVRRVDPSVQLVACGSSHRRMPTFGSWESTVLEHAYDEVDLISMHAYYENPDGDLDSFLAASVDMDSFITEVESTADSVKTRLKSDKTINISFDEWNVWYQSRFVGETNLEIEHLPRLIEDHYDLSDAVVVGSFLTTLLRHAERVKVANQAQLVNVIAPIRSEPGGPSWRQPIFWPFALVSAMAKGTSLRVAPQAPTIDTVRYGTVSALDMAATHDAESGDLAVFVAHRGRDGALDLQVALHGLGVDGLRVVEHRVVTGDDPQATNTAEDPDHVVAVDGKGAEVSDGSLHVTLPPLSFTALRLACA
jgi:alpha-N-arabinofuranosidase